MYHKFLIHSSADGHLGCFHVLTIVNSAAKNIGIHESLPVLVSLVCMPNSGIAGSYGSFLSSFLRNIHPVLIVAVLVCIPTNSVWGSLFSTPFPAFIVCRLFDSSHPDWRVMVPHCGFVKSEHLTKDDFTIWNRYSSFSHEKYMEMTILFSLSWTTSYLKGSNSWDMGEEVC